MRNLFIALALGALTVPASAQDLVGEYRLAEGPDVAGGLRITADGRFKYGLAAGALDERAEGRWERRGNRVCLFTEPVPVRPVFEKVPLRSVDGKAPTLWVTWPNGDGVSGVLFIIGFDAGEPVDGYTQFDGWTAPDDDVRIPRWIEVSESIYNITAPRFELEPADAGRLHLRLVPNDMGVVGFDGACVEASGKGVILHRDEGEMRFVRVDATSE